MSGIHPYAPEYRRQMVELVRAGRTPGELSREFECSASVVRNRLRLRTEIAHPLPAATAGARGRTPGRGPERRRRPRPTPGGAKPSPSPLGRPAGLGLAILLVATLAIPARAERPVHEFPKTDFDRRTIDLSEIRSGGPPRDGIPAIDVPLHTTTEEAAGWLDPDEPVIAVELGGESRAYPLRILIWHEIANDELGNTPIAVTFCPLCSSAIVFDRRLDGTTLDFGTTGRLRFSDLVMYDRQTESWWQQLTGTGLVGEHAGRELVRLPAAIVAWSEFRAAFPEGTVLSRETGYTRAYGSNPYAGYDTTAQPFLLQGTPDPRLPAMERVLHVRAGGAERIYPFGALDAEPIINDELGGEPIVVLSREGTLSVLDESRIADSRRIPSAAAYSRRLAGRVLEFELRDGRIADTGTGSTWNLFGEAGAGALAGSRLTLLSEGEHFAFAWLAFHPDADVYGVPAPR